MYNKGSTYLFPFTKSIFKYTINQIKIDSLKIINKHNQIKIHLSLTLQLI